MRWGLRRPRVLGLIGLLIVLLVTAAEAPAHEYLRYVGTYTGKGSEGIYAYRFDPATGETRPVGLAAATDNPSFLAVDPNGRFLYAVNEVDALRNEPTGAGSVFAIDRESGRLTLLQQVSSLGGGPAHVSLDTSARYLMVANANGGRGAVFPIGNDGRLGHEAFVQNAGSSVNPERQAGPHAPGGAYDYVVKGQMIGGFALVAYPARYGSSGIMTFIVNQDGIVYQKDLGKTTEKIAGAMKTFDPDATWKKAEGSAAQAK